MNIFGVGGPELIIILIIMLVFAGPKRMIHWSYLLGQYLAKFRKIWSETVDLVQQEFDQAGVDIKLPKQPPTRQNINKAITDAMKPLSDPLQETLDEVQKDVENVKSVSEDIKQKASLNTKDEPKPIKSPVPKQDVEKTKSDLGAWSNQTQKSTNGKQPNGNQIDMGTWSSSSTE